MMTWQVAQLLAEHDIPVGSRTRIADPDRAERSLLDHRDHPEASRLGRQAGLLIARLHALPSDDPALPLAAIGPRLPDLEELSASLTAPSRRRIQAVLGALEARLQEAPHHGSLLHGRLTPELISVRPDAEATPPVRLIGLEHSGTGPDGADLGTWLARCTTARTPTLAQEFLRGYGSCLELPEDQELEAWTARALLLSGLDPEHPDDGESADSCFALAETVLDGGVLPAGP